MKHQYTYNNQCPSGEGNSKQKGEVVAALVGVVLGLPGAAGYRQLVHGGRLEVFIVVAPHCKPQPYTSLLHCWRNGWDTSDNTSL